MQALNAPPREVLRTEAHTALADELGSVLQAEQVEGLMSYLEAHQPQGGKGNRGAHQGGRHQQMKQSSPRL